jgi:DNA-directed RNA polymerase III subunit RPC2
MEQTAQSSVFSVAMANYVKQVRQLSTQVDVEYTVGRQVRRRRDVVIGRMPIMLRSNCCVLNRATDSELITCNECPLDPGGYFVVRGTEKVILIQEQLSKNRMLVERDPDGDVTVFVTSTDSERKTMTKLKHKKGIFLLAHSIFEKPVNLAIVFKALGIESDQVSNAQVLVQHCALQRETVLICVGMQCCELLSVQCVGGSDTGLLS